MKPEDISGKERGNKIIKLKILQRTVKTRTLGTCIE
jgi:hypothetical protein